MGENRNGIVAAENRTHYSTLADFIMDQSGHRGTAAFFFFVTTLTRALTRDKSRISRDPSSNSSVSPPEHASPLGIIADLDQHYLYYYSGTSRTVVQGSQPPNRVLFPNHIRTLSTTESRCYTCDSEAKLQQTAIHASGGNRTPRVFPTLVVSVLIVV